MNLRRIAGGFAIAAFCGFGWVVVSTAGATDQSPKSSAVTTPPPADREAEIKKLDQMITQQEKVLKQLEHVQDSGLPGIASIAHELLDTIRLNQAQLIQVIGSLQQQCTLADLVPIGLPGYLPPE